MNATEEEVNPYELLNIKLDSTEQEVKTAYRQKSLKVHPDRVCLDLLLDDPIHNLRFWSRIQIIQKQVARQSYHRTYSICLFSF